MGEQSTNRKSFLAASESTENDDAVLEILRDEDKDINYLDLAEVSIMPEIVEIDRDRERPSISGVRQGKIPDKCQVQATIPLAGGVDPDSSGDEAPAYNMFLKAMGLKETITDGSKSEYSPASVQQEAMSFHEYVHNVDDSKSRVQRSTGIRGGGSITWELDAEGRLEFEGVGSYYKQSDEAEFFDSDGKILLEPDASTSVPDRVGGDEKFIELYGIIAKDLVCNIDGNVDFELQSATLNVEWDQSERPAITGSSRWRRTLNTKGTSGGHFSLELAFKNREAFEKVLSNYDTENLFPFHLELDDGSRRIQLDAPKVQFQAPGYEDDDNVRAYSVTAILVGDWSGLRADNDFTLTFDTPS